LGETERNAKWHAQMYAQSACPVQNKRGSLDVMLVFRKIMSNSSCFFAL